MTDDAAIAALIRKWADAVHDGDIDTVLADHAAISSCSTSHPRTRVFAASKPAGRPGHPCVSCASCQLLLAVTGRLRICCDSLPVPSPAGIGHLCTSGSVQTSSN